MISWYHSKLIHNKTYNTNIKSNKLPLRSSKFSFTSGVKQKTFGNNGRLILISPGMKCRIYASSKRENIEPSTEGSVFPFGLTKHQLKVGLLGALTTCLGVTNRVLYKMALVPLNEYPFFLAQLTTFGYVAIYFTILMWRYKAGIVTKEMIAIPKRLFAMMGFLEAVGLATGMAASAVLPGALISILNQTYLAWQLLLSWLVLKKKFSLIQILGCAIVITGVIIVVSSGGTGSSSLSLNFGFWPFLLVLSALFPACSSILKEFVFRDASKRLKGGNLDIFVVNSFGSGFQALFVFFLLPVLSRLKGIQLAQLPSYFTAGAGCLLNFGGKIEACKGAPLVPLIYVCANLAFNISALTLLKESSGIVASLLLTLSVPLTIATFTLPLPLLGNPAPLPPGFGVGLGVLLLGLLLYNVGGVQKEKET